MDFGRLVCQSGLILCSFFIQFAGDALVLSMKFFLKDLICTDLVALCYCKIIYSDILRHNMLTETASFMKH